jgi:hypothetical protein
MWHCYSFCVIIIYVQQHNGFESIQSLLATSVDCTFPVVYMAMHFVIHRYLIFVHIRLVLMDVYDILRLFIEYCTNPIFTICNSINRRVNTILIIIQVPRLHVYAIVWSRSCTGLIISFSFLLIDVHQFIDQLIKLKLQRDEHSVKHLI